MLQITACMWNGPQDRWQGKQARMLRWNRLEMPGSGKTYRTIDKSMKQPLSNQRRTLTVYGLVKRGWMLEGWAYRDDHRAQAGNWRKQAWAESWGMPVSEVNKKQAEEQKQKQVLTDWKTRQGSKSESGVGSHGGAGSGSVSESESDWGKANMFQKWTLENMHEQSPAEEHCTWRNSWMTAQTSDNRGGEVLGSS